MRGKYFLNVGRSELRPFVDLVKVMVASSEITWLSFFGESHGTFHRNLISDLHSLSNRSKLLSLLVDDGVKV